VGKQDLIVRFIADTGNINKGLDGLRGRFVGVASSMEGIAKAGAALGATAFFKHAIDEAREAAKMTRQTEQAIRSTGGAAGVTAKHVDNLAVKMSRLSGVDDELIAHGANVLLTFTKVANKMGEGNDIFDQAAQLALDMTAALGDSALAGNDLQGSITRIGKALQDPVKGMTALAKVGVSFTAEQKEEIRALVAKGDTLGAQKVILAELRTEYGGMAAASADAGGKLKVAWDNLAEDVGTKLMPAFNGISDWATSTGIPALGATAETVSGVLTPVVKTLVHVGGGLVKFFSDLPGPVQAGVIALGAWALVGDKVTSKFGQMSGPMKSFGNDVKTVMQASQGEVGRFGASIQVLQDRVPTVGAMGAAFRTAKGDVEGFASTARGVGAAAFTGLKGAASGLVGFLGGPWGVALAAVTVGIGLWVSSSQKAAREQRELADAGKSVADAIREQNGVMNESVRHAAAKAAQDKGLLKLAGPLGIQLWQVTDAILGQAGAQDQLKAKLQGIVSAHTRQVVAVNAGRGAATSYRMELDEEGKTALELIGKLDSVTGGKNEQLEADRQLALATKTEADMLGIQTAAMDDNSASNRMLKDAVESLGGTFDDTKTDGQHLVDVIKGLTEAQTTAIDLEESYEGALDKLTESIQTNGATLDIHTEKGRNNRDALEAAASSIRDMTLADIESGVPAQEAIRKHDDRVRALEAEAKKLGLTKDETHKLILKYSEVPANVRTIIETQGYEAAYEKLKTLNIAQRALAEGISIRTAHGLYGNEPAAQKASGGLITGPGGPTSDMVPIWASNREFMQRASAVEYYGVGVMNALNQRRIPRDVFAPRFADGGYVNWPFPVDASKTKIPAFASAVNVSGSGGPGVERWSGLVLQVLAMLGQPAGLLSNVLRRMNQESGGNPAAINLWDSNAKRGTPSIGLMQTIQPTFNRWAGPFLGRGIYDPLANIYAGLNYAIHRYPSLKYAMDKPGGYDQGGWLIPGGTNQTGRPEAVLNPEQSAAFVNLAKAGGKVEKHYHLTVYATNTEIDLTEQFRKLELAAGSL
jgi:hypothetical protein